MSIFDWLRRLFTGARPAATSAPVSNFERASPRRPARLYVRARGDTLFIERRGNISGGGFAFVGDRRFEVGDKVEIRFRLPDSGTSIFAVGEVLETGAPPDGKTTRACIRDIDIEDLRMLERWAEDPGPYSS